MPRGSNSLRDEMRCATFDEIVVPLGQRGTSGEPGRTRRIGWRPRHSGQAQREPESRPNPGWIPAFAGMTTNHTQFKARHCLHE